jgi:hypothetical protein
MQSVGCSWSGPWESWDSGSILRNAAIVRYQTVNCKQLQPSSLKARVAERVQELRRQEGREAVQWPGRMSGCEVDRTTP